MDKAKSKNIKAILRWITFLPVAIIAGFLAYNIAWFIHELAITFVFIDSEKLFGISFIRFFSYLYMGLSTVYVACFVAPSNKKIVALITGGLVLIFFWWNNFLCSNCT